MYINKTTAAERLIIRQGADSPMDYVARARRLLMQVLDKHFEDAEQKPIGSSDAEDVADLLHAVNDALWFAEAEYGLTIGDAYYSGVKPSYEGAERALRVREVERLRDKIGLDVCKEYESLDDEKALPILRELAKEKGVLVDG